MGSVIKMFRVNEKDKSFDEDESRRLTLASTDEITYCEFDKTFDNIVLLKNKSVVELRSLESLQTASKTLQLQESVGRSSSKLLTLSADGTLCVIGGGADKNYFYLVNIEKETQAKLISAALSDALSPCFINGDNEHVAVGGDGNEGVEIWDVESKSSTRNITIDDGFISAMASTNNILAVGSRTGSLQLWDVRNWQMFYSAKYKMIPRSVHLTSDSKYLTVGGSQNEAHERC